jgi:hypothetical protein
VGRAVALAARTLGSALVSGPFARRLFAPQRVDVRTDGVPPVRVELSLLVAATVRSVGLGFRPSYRAGEQPGRFHLVASGLGPADLALRAHRCWAGRPLEPSTTSPAIHLDRLSQRAELVALDADAPLTYVFDGDSYTDHRLELTAGPRLALIRP